MRDSYDFSKAKKAKDVPHLSKLRKEAKGKTRITIMLDNDVLESYRKRADKEGTGYQTLINKTLRESSGSKPVDAKTLRKIIREELHRS
ncbi:MAG: BrnA antitoxin family protein [Gammaproteobacteria bacterium]